MTIRPGLSRSPSRPADDEPAPSSVLEQALTRGTELVGRLDSVLERANSLTGRITGTTALRGLSPDKASAEGIEGRLQTILRALEAVAEGLEESFDQLERFS